MKSRGPWYSPKTKALGVLVARAVQTGSFNWSTAEGLLANVNGSEQPVPKTMRAWARNSPAYPEQAIRDGLVQIEELPPLARNQVDKPLTMGQKTYINWFSGIVVPIGAPRVFECVRPSSN